MAIKSLNLSENYVPNWAQWEIVREIYCNFLDADSDFTQYVTAHSVTFATTETPSLARLTVLGASTSRGNNDNIGEFGEGFKLAALVATRMGYGLEVFSPEGHMTFKLQAEKGLSERVLSAVISPKKKYDGCKIILHMPDVENFISNNFVKRDRVLFERKSNANARLYCKGVFICNIEEKTLYDWNLNMTLNRDRSTVSSWDLRNAIGNELSNGNTEHPQDVYDNIMKNPNSIEMRGLKGRYSPDSWAKARLHEAFYNIHGEEALVSSENDYQNTVAVIKGHKIVDSKLVPENWGLPSVEKILSNNDIYEIIEVDDNIRKTVNVAMDILEAPFEVRFFKIFDDAPLGKCEGGVVFINQMLCLPGRMHQLLSTLCHEICHIQGDGDGTLGFEYKLDELCGKLLKKLIER